MRISGAQHLNVLAPSIIRYIASRNSWNLDLEKAFFLQNFPIFIDCDVDCEFQSKCKNLAQLLADPTHPEKFSKIEKTLLLFGCNLHHSDVLYFSVFAFVYLEIISKKSHLHIVESAS